MTTTLASENVWDRLPDCPECKGDGVVEVYAHPLAAEPTQTIYCPKCGSGLPVRSAS